MSDWTRCRRCPSTVGAAGTSKPRRTALCPSCQIDAMAEAFADEMDPDGYATWGQDAQRMDV